MMSFRLTPKRAVVVFVLVSVALTASLLFYAGKSPVFLGVADCERTSACGGGGVGGWVKLPNALTREQGRRQCAAMLVEYRDEHPRAAGSESDRLCCYTSPATG